jgi:hypothetical protein
VETADNPQWSRGQVAASQVCFRWLAIHTLTRIVIQLLLLLLLLLLIAGPAVSRPCVNCIELHSLLPEKCLRDYSPNLKTKTISDRCVRPEQSGGNTVELKLKNTEHSWPLTHRLRMPPAVAVKSSLQR